MKKQINQWIDTLSDFFAYRKGLLPLLGLVLIFLNLILQFVPGSSWVASSNLLLHLGLLVAIVGFLLGWAL